MPGSPMKHTNATGTNRRRSPVPDAVYKAMASATRSPLEVVFYKEILDHFGFSHRCELMRVSMASTGRDLAIQDALQRFERAERVSNWRVAADGYEVVSASTPER